MALPSSITGVCRVVCAIAEGVELYKNWGATRSGEQGERHSRARSPAREDQSHVKSTNYLVRRMFQNVSFRDERLKVTNYLIVPPHGFCNTSIFVVIVPSKNEYSVLFAVGIPKSQEVQRKLYLESQLYGDLLQADFEDVYHNLTLKRPSQATTRGPEEEMERSNQEGLK
ncbi:hypothetical protein TELCIR_03999 [Teladorsagia circumcincta]|uniref:Uncharacterized protein n=1 Tax=Teladorsagia circumcincta TaxID=45464 RepID=A0A2G9UW96_TELCI|nr:hypothetical protein TELCIR_03999 [Teladorsagia circumcincta]